MCYLILLYYTEYFGAKPSENLGLYYSNPLIRGIITIVFFK